MFACQREISTLNQAIDLVIGFKALKGIIVAATLRQLSRNFGAIAEDDLGELDLHCSCFLSTRTTFEKAVC